MLRHEAIDAERCCYIDERYADGASVVFRLFAPVAYAIIMPRWYADAARLLDADASVILRLRAIISPDAAAADAMPRRAAEDTAAAITPFFD